MVGFLIRIGPISELVKRKSIKKTLYILIHDPIFFCICSYVFRNIEIRICIEDGYDLNEYIFVSHL